MGNEIIHPLPSYHAQAKPTASLVAEDAEHGFLCFTLGGEEFGVDSQTRESGFDFAQMLDRYGEVMDLQPEGHAIA